MDLSSGWRRWLVPVSVPVIVLAVALALTRAAGCSDAAYVADAALATSQVLGLLGVSLALAPATRRLHGGGGGGTWGGRSPSGGGLDEFDAPSGRSYEPADDGDGRLETRYTLVVLVSALLLFVAVIAAENAGVVESGCVGGLFG